MNTTQIAHGSKARFSHFNPLGRETHRPVPHIFKLSEHLSEFVVPLLCLLIASFAITIMLRIARLRWTWALLGAPIACLVWPIDWISGFCLFVVTALVSATGFYWQLKDIERGGEEARAAKERLGPLHLALTWTKQRRMNGQRVEASKRRRNGQRTEATLAIGRTRRGSLYTVPFGIEEGRHGLVLGATGAGKTYTQAAIAQAHICVGHPVIAVDPKGDGPLRAQLVAAAEHFGVPFYEWSPTGPTVYNPYARGDVTQVADKLLAAQDWSEPHYRSATNLLLLCALKTMREAGIWPPTISQIVRYTDLDELDLLSSRVGEEGQMRVQRYLAGRTARSKADLGGGRDRIAILAEGTFGSRLDPALGSGTEIDLKRAIEERAVIYFCPDSDGFPEASRLFGAALVIDLVTLSAELQGEKRSGLIVLDEFGALGADQVSRLFARARSAGFSLLLGAQSLADMREARGESKGADTLTEQLLTNMTYSVVHREVVPDAAELLAGVVGTQPSWTTTQRIGGPLKKSWFETPEGTRTRTREFVVLPDEFKRLRTGEAVLINPTAKVTGEIVRVYPPVNLRGRG
jgi:TraM recognition site of TraD and TraG/Helicase HerA-like C-terminal